MEEWLALCEYEKSGRRVQLTERNDSLLFQAGAGAKHNTAKIRNKQPQKYQVKCHKNTKWLIVFQIKSVSLYWKGTPGAHGLYHRQAETGSGTSESRKASRHRCKVGSRSGT